MTQTLEVAAHATKISSDALDQLFRQARTHSAWLPIPVSLETLREVYELARMGPTSVNSNPARFVFLESAAAKARLLPALSPGNVEKTKAAPVAVIVAWDTEFHEKLPQVFPHKEMRSHFAGKPSLIEEMAMRNGMVEFVRDLAKLRTAEHKKPEIALTTNGHLLAEIAQPLKDAGLDRVTVSMDAVDPERFARMTRVPNGYDSVLAGVRAARQAGLGPVKINCVLLRSFNEDQIIPFGMFAREERVPVRFNEFMPLEEDRVWTPEIAVTLEEIVSRMSEYLPLEEMAHEPSETARRYRFRDGVGEIGIIAPVSNPFCGHCSRIRITSDGKLRTCLFSVWDHDLHELMRRGATDEKLTEFIVKVIEKKEERHHIGEPGFVPASRTMVHIGG